MVVGFNSKHSLAVYYRCAAFSSFVCRPLEHEHIRVQVALSVRLNANFCFLCTDENVSPNVTFAREIVISLKMHKSMLCRPHIISYSLLFNSKILKYFFCRLLPMCVCYVFSLWPTYFLVSCKNVNCRINFLFMQFHSSLKQLKVFSSVLKWHFFVEVVRACQLHFFCSRFSRSFQKLFE